MPNIGARPAPNALKPHLGPAMGTSSSRHSNLAGGFDVAGQPPHHGVAMSLDSKALSQYVKGPVSGSRAQLNALRTSVDSARHSRGAAVRQGLFSPTALANNANLGRLPTLGLNQIKLEEFQD